MLDVIPLVIRCLRLANGQLLLEAEGARERVECPSCGAESDQVHGHYQRLPLDLPWRGQPVRVSLRVRRFRCLVPECERQTFAEAFPGLAPRKARRTAAATTFLIEVAKQMGGEAGARVARAAGLPVSPDTLLRILRDGDELSPSTPRVLGVDDFAFRRRHRYGTILIDLETHRPVDLLDDRLAETLADWLRQHPGVEIVVRDRSGAYAEGAKHGAPSAIQVADRFHLVQNATQALEELLRSRPRRSVYVAGPDPPSPQPSAAQQAAAAVPDETLAPEALSPARRQQAERTAARVARWEEVHARRKRGDGFRQIARDMHLSRITVHRLLERPRPNTAPLARPSRPSGLDSPKLRPFAGYIGERWQAGFTNVRQLFRELSAQGYTGSYSLLEQTLLPFRPPRLLRRERRRGKRRRVSVRWLCLRPSDTLTTEEHAALNSILAEDTQLARGHELRLRFHDIVNGRNIEALDAWLADAHASRLSPFIILAHGLERDRAAVDAALTFDWSNGPVEGHVHRLKLIKRQCYGRAKADLLRRRVLAA
jgi:transposase